jgi:hypothetical protein
MTTEDDAGDIRTPLDMVAGNRPSLMVAGDGLSHVVTDNEQGRVVPDGGLGQVVANNELQSRGPTTPIWWLIGGGTDNKDTTKNK